MIGCYSICYFQAMAHGVTPGVIATLLGVQPILTLLLLERRFSPLRLLGLLVALAGLADVIAHAGLLDEMRQVVDEVNSDPGQYMDCMLEEPKVSWAPVIVAPISVQAPITPAISTVIL